MQWIFTSNNKLIQERFSVQKSLSMASWIMFPNKRKKGTSHWSPDFSSTEELCALNSGQPRSQSSLYPSIRTARREPWDEIESWIPDSGLQMLAPGLCQQTLDSRIQSLLGHGIPDFFSSIPDSSSKNFPHSSGWIPFGGESFVSLALIIGWD